jgi:hypothetical protein
MQLSPAQQAVTGGYSTTEAQTGWFNPAMRRAVLHVGMSVLI